MRSSFEIVSFGGFGFLFGGFDWWVGVNWAFHCWKFCLKGCLLGRFCRFAALSDCYI